MAQGPLSWQEEQSLSAGIVRDLRTAIYIWPAEVTSYQICQVEASSKPFAVPPVYGSYSPPRPQGMLVYRDDGFHIGFGARNDSSIVQAAANEPYYRATADTMAGYIPGGVMWQIPLHPAVSTIFVFSTEFTSKLRANWVYQR